MAVIDVPGQHWCALDRMCGGFAEPMQFEGSSLICTNTAFDKERRAHVETCAVDLAARHDWRSVVLGQP